MHVLHVVIPRVQRRIERKRLLLGGRQLVPHRHEVSRVEDAVHLGVHAVQLDEGEPALQPLALCVQVVGQRRRAGAKRQTLHQPLGRLGEAQRRPCPSRELRPGRVGPVGRPDRLPVLVAERFLAEILAADVWKPAVPQRIPAARRDVIETRLGIRWRARSHRQHRVDDEVHGDDVEHGVGQAGEVLQDAPPERQDDRLGHPEAFEPAGERLGQRALDDRGPHDRQRHVAVQLDHGVLRHRLRERVDVAEAHRVRVHAAALDEPVLHPLLAQALGGARHRGRARRSDARPRLASQLAKHLRTPRLFLDRPAQRRQHLGLVSPVQTRVERHLLAHQPANQPTHERG